MITYCTLQRVQIFTFTTCFIIQGYHRQYTIVIPETPPETPFLKAQEVTYTCQYQTPGHSTGSWHTEDTACHRVPLYHSNPIPWSPKGPRYHMHLPSNRHLTYWRHYHYTAQTPDHQATWTMGIVEQMLQPNCHSCLSKKHPRTRTPIRHYINEICLAP